MRAGADYRHPGRDHARTAVWIEIVLQVLQNYSSLPDVRTLETSELRFLYNGIRATLKEHTKSG